MELNLVLLLKHNSRLIESNDMAADPYLIAHRVRNEPAFDVAMQMQCPECGGKQDEPANANWEHQYECHECDSLGYWWIIPTSGHRAYPWWHCDLIYSPDGYEERLHNCVPPMPPSTPDHYPHRSHVTPTISLAEALGLNKPKPQSPIIRRI
jgi:hypothetical protein